MSDQNDSQEVHSVSIHYSHGSSLSAVLPEEVLTDAMTEANVARNNDVLLYSILLGAVLVMMVAIGALYLVLPPEEQVLPASVGYTNPVLLPDDGLGQYEAAFSGLALKAHSAFVYDATYDKALFSREAREEMPLASITKLLTAAVAYDVLGGSSTVTIIEDDLHTEGDTGLLVGEEWQSEDLIQFMLVLSSNDAARALARAGGTRLIEEEIAEQSASLSRLAFTQAMNRKLRDWALADTHVSNPTGLDLDETESGAYGSALSVASLMYNLRREYPELVDPTRHGVTTYTSLSGFEHKATNTNVRADQLTGLTASKTGYTDLAGGNLVVAVDIGLGHEIIVAVLGSSLEERFTDVEYLVAAAREYYQHK